MILVKRGAGIDVIEVNPLPSSNMQKSVMGEEQITLSFEIPGFVDLRPGDYITYEGSTWTLNKLPQVKKLSSRLWQYNAVFQSTKYELAKAMYMLFDNTPTPLQGEFSLTGNANTFMALLVSNINRTSTSTWSLGQVIENTDYKTLTFSNEDCLSVLARLAGEFETEYHVNNRVVHLKKISTSRAVNLQYGSTAYDIERSSVDSSDIVTRLYPFGSIKNLRPDYRGGNSPLRIPIAYLDKLENNVSLYGIIERAKTWEDIYPRLSSGGAGIVTSVGNEFTFSDSALDFNVNNYLLGGTTGKVHFTTGQCAGYDFEIKSYNNTTKTFVITANVEDNDFTLPTSLIKPAVGDKYVLIDVIMPPEYEEAAEVELLAKAQQFLTENSTPKVNYKVTFSEIYARQNLQNIECGDTVGIIDNDLGINVQIRIIKLTKGITDYWNVQFDLANVVSSTRIERIEGSVSNIQNSVVVANQRINLNNLRAYQNTKELQELVFNVDGYFEPANIKPLSIETSMLSSGAKSQFFQLTSLLQPNYAGNSQLMHWSAGILTHFTIAETIREWTISAGSITITGSNTSIPLYIYARCFRTGTTGAIYLNSAAIKPDSDPTYFYFLIGVLHSPISGVRGISLNYGQTTINGGFIRTGVIQSIDGATYFNLNTGEFRGNFKFTSGETIQDYVGTKIDNIKIGAANLLSQSAYPIFFANLAGTGSSVLITSEPDPYYRATPDVGKIVSVYGAQHQHLSGKEYISSIYVRQNSGAPANITLYHEGNPEDSLKITSVESGVWTQIATRKYTAAGNGYLILISSLESAPLDYKKVKIEFGTIATDWSPSQEDTRGEINGAYDYADSAISDLQIGGENNYDGTNSISITSTGGSTPNLSLNQANNGFDILSSDGGHLTEARISNVVKQNGYHAVTCYIRVTSGSAPVIIDICDSVAASITATTDWQKVQGVVNVNNFSELIYNFADIHTSVYCEIQVKEFMVQRGNKPTAYRMATEYLAKAIAGSTEIAGGAVITNLLLMKNMGGAITAGISGLTLDNIAMWAGGNYEAAVADSEKPFRSNMATAMLDKKNGAGHKAFGKLAWDENGNTYFAGIIEALAGKIGGLDIYENSLKSETMAFSESPVETLAQLVTPTSVGISYISSWSDTGYNETATAESQEITITVDSQLRFRASCEPELSADYSDRRWTVNVLLPNGTSVYQQSGNGTLTNQLFIVNLPAGTYKIRARAMAVIPIGESYTNYASITGELGSTIYAAGYSYQTKIGSDGFYSFWNTDKYIYFKSNYGFEGRWGNIGLRFVSGQSNPQKMVGGTWSNL